MFQMFFDEGPLHQRSVGGSKGKVGVTGHVSRGSKVMDEWWKEKCLVRDRKAKLRGYLYLQGRLCDTE